jgi:hypothetical protein
MMLMMFEVMCDLLVMCGAWGRGEVMGRVEVTVRSLTERTEVNKKVSYQISIQTKVK